MSMKKNAQDDVGRRVFLKLFGAGAAAGALPLSGRANAEEASTPPAATQHMPVAAGAQGNNAGYVFFNVDEAAFIEAAVDTLIPSDTVGPGAKELGVSTYIDRQMASGFGKGDRLYLDGPFSAGTPEQGYQLQLVPSEIIRLGIADTAAYVKTTYNSRFESLPEYDRAAVMADLESGKFELAAVPNAAFFGLLLQLTIEGYFADPLYGGNKGKAAWKMIGFPGAGAMYADKIEAFRNRPYTAEPKGIQDLI